MKKRKAMRYMNYNEEYRTVRGRVLNNCGACRTQRNCGCPRNTARTADCGCQHNTDHHITDCEKKKTDCGSCTNDTTVVVRENHNNTFNGTVCTTVPVAESCVDSYPVAMAYVPMQQWRELYDPASAVSRGTIFRELDLEWYPTNCRKDCHRGNN